MVTLLDARQPIPGRRHGCCVYCHNLDPVTHCRWKVPGVPGKGSGFHPITCGPADNQRTSPGSAIAYPAIGRMQQGSRRAQAA
jgi:hypothetical protein